MTKKDIRKYKLTLPKKYICDHKKKVYKSFKEDVSIYLLLLFSIMFLLSTSSYAYLSVKLENIIENIVSANIEGITLTNDSINVQDLYPASPSEVMSAAVVQGNNQCKNSTNQNICYLYEFTLTNSGSTSKLIDYYIIPTVNTFSNLKFKIYNTKKTQLSSNSLLNVNVTSIKKDEIKLTNMTGSIKPNETLSYTIIYFIEKQTNEVSEQTIADAARSFDGHIKIELSASASY